MAGLFPKDGVPPNQTINAINPAVGAGCKVLFHAALCVGRFNPAAANAVISEITQAVNLIDDYDCNRLDNLAKLIKMNLCEFNEVPFTPSSAFLAGCFNGISGKVNLNDIINWVINNQPPPQVYSICNLTGSTQINDEDTIGVCSEGSDVRIPASVFKDYFAGGSGAKTWMFGPRIGSLQGMNAVFPVNGRKVFFVEDMRGNDPPQLEMMGYKIDRLEGVGLPTIPWEYGRIWLMIYIDALGAWVRVHKTGLSWAIPGSNVSQLVFNMNSVDVSLFEAIPMS